MNTDQLQKAIEQVADEEKTRSLIVGTEPAPDAPLTRASVHSWFFTFMCMNIPIVGWIYLLYLAFNKKKTERRNFARAYLFYKLVFTVIALIILVIVVWIAMDLLDELLAYMEML